MISKLNDSSSKEKNEELTKEIEEMRIKLVGASRTESRNLWAKIQQLENQIVSYEDEVGKFED